MLPPEERGAKKPEKALYSFYGRISMKVRQYFAKYGVRAAVVLVAAVLLALLGAGVHDGRAGAVRDGAGSVTMPIKRAATAVVDWMESLYNYIFFVYNQQFTIHAGNTF